MTAPSTTVDLFADATLADPYPVYAELRALGPAVRLEAHDAWALPRHHEVRAALSDWQTFSSAGGVAFNPTTNAYLHGNVLASDPPTHRTLRHVLADPLTPRRLEALRADLDARATSLVDSVIERGSFDAVADLVEPFVLDVLADLAGVPADVRPSLPAWSAAAFDAFGPLNARAAAGRAVRGEMAAWTSSVTAADLIPGSIGRGIYEACDAGMIDDAACAPLMSALVTAGTDTTVSALAHAVAMFAEHPDQWEIARHVPDDGGWRDVFDEVLRHGSPIHAFTRTATTATLEVIEPGERVVMMFASANHDERRYPEPERFDVTRRPGDHASFGRGVHACLGQALARIQAAALFSALAARVRRFDAGPPVPLRNNVLHGLAELPVCASRR